MPEPIVLDMTPEMQEKQRVMQVRVMRKVAIDQRTADMFMATIGMHAAFRHAAAMIYGDRICQPWADALAVA